MTEEPKGITINIPESESQAVEDISDLLPNLENPDSKKNIATLLAIAATGYTCIDDQKVTLEDAFEKAQYYDAHSPYTQSYEILLELHKWYRNPTGKTKQKAKEELAVRITGTSLQKSLFENLDHFMDVLLEFREKEEKEYRQEFSDALERADPKRLKNITSAIAKSVYDDLKNHVIDEMLKYTSEMKRFMDDALKTARKSGDSNGLYFAADTLRTTGIPALQTYAKIKLKEHEKSLSK